MTAKLEAMFTEYDKYHLHPTNRLTHKIGIPLIFFNALAMLDWVNIAPVAGPYSDYLTLALVAVVACGFWYLSLSLKLGILMVLAFIGMWALGWITPVWLVIVAGIVGWVVQFLGHIVWEKKAPNFTSNLVQSLIGPIYFAALATGDWAVPGKAAPGTSRQMAGGGVG